MEQFCGSIKRRSTLARVDAPSHCLHPAGNDLALHELVTAWHQLSVDVRETIVRIARDL
jgi:hypothetical protein